MSLFRELFELYENGELVFLADGKIGLTDAGAGRALAVAAALDPESANALLLIIQRMEASSAMEALRLHHSRAMNRQSQAPNHSADLKSALRLH